MAIARKLDRVIAFDPDIVVLQECSQRDVACCGATTSYWTGASPRKGLGVLVYGELARALDPCASKRWPWFLPVTVGDVHVLAIWACVLNRKTRYVRVAHEVVDHCLDFLSADIVVASGDFNSNSVWDQEHGELSHSSLVEKFGRMGMVSAYHAVTGESQGCESTSTQFMYRHADKGFHLDYAFVSKSIIGKSTLAVGSASEWLALSDHMPLILDIPD